MSQWHDYLSELYSEKNEDMNLDNYDENFSNPFDYAFTCNKIRQAITKLKNNKQPGPDQVRNILSMVVTYFCDLLLNF